MKFIVNLFKKKQINKKQEQSALALISHFHNAENGPTAKTFKLK
jgi:hypothetical protein